MGDLLRTGVFTGRSVLLIVMEDRYSVLVSKILSGEASEEERKEFRQFLADNPDYDFTYNQLKEYWNADIRSTLMDDREQVTDKIMARIKANDSEPVVKKSSLRIAVAAAVLFFVTTCALIYMYKEQVGSTYTYAAQSVPVEYTLADGSKITLNKNSSISLAPDYGDKFRNVKLEGEAYFVVAKDKSRPFVVETKGTKTRVLGTSFNIKTQGNDVVATLVEGSVLFTSSGCKETLRPNEELRYNVSTSKFDRYACDVQMNTAWVSGRFNYSGVSFATFVSKLEEIYNRKIQVSDNQLASRIVSASFLVEEPIEDILEALKGELKFTYVIDKTNSINISGR